MDTEPLMAQVKGNSREDHTMKQVVFTIPRITPSLNKLLRMHYRTRMVERESWEKEVLIGLFAVECPKAKHNEKRSVDITSYRISLLDHDNFIGGLKILIDALKNLKYIYDDDLEHLYLEAKQEKVAKRKEQRTEVIITYP